ncbi:MAG: aminoacyl-tRNA hydrolase [Bacteroidetes bacterium]|nr:aminoacyl-tRNA hydrolase [Bacteroidota bacterium]MBL6962385.1 aminoacyl-tRNA hydrolase [Bacteroidota bacterium]
MKQLIIGLGNIGEEYANTRHNIGFSILDFFAHKYDFKFESARYAFKAEYKIKNKQLVFIKPTTFMNRSGKAIRYWLKKLGIPVENILVLVDDVALPLGKVRIRAKGGDGGHNGLSNIIDILQTDQFPRLRIGVGSDYPKGYQVDHVLGKWTEDEISVLSEKLVFIHDAIYSFIFEGLSKAMTKYNHN